MTEESTDTLVNGSEQDERAEKIRPQTSKRGESHVHRTQIQGLTSLTRLTSVQKLSRYQKQDIHFIHQSHPKVHLGELTVETLKTNKNPSFISFTVILRVEGK